MIDLSPEFKAVLEERKQEKIAFVAETLVSAIQKGCELDLLIALATNIHDRMTDAEVDLQYMKAHEEENKSVFEIANEMAKKAQTRKAGE